ncbi:hypothetical protein TNCT_626701 [Trichonephila clavata]|uniref:Uncharacterized protein n=1 Tax=Trichonephila clavata TaxID=2740835 RepID=A0A8X6H670_TRICU|nr:hypothetical protein TNCT_626701 [Trichonephila clavata]
MFQKEGHQNVKIQALLKAKKRWASEEIELEHQSLHVCENDPDASGNVSSNYENNEVNTYPLNSSELNAATEKKAVSSKLTHFCRTCDK